MPEQIPCVSHSCLKMLLGMMEATFFGTADGSKGVREQLLGSDLSLLLGHSPCTTKFPDVAFGNLQG